MGEEAFAMGEGGLGLSPPWDQCLGTLVTVWAGKERLRYRYRNKDEETHWFKYENVEDKKAYQRNSMCLGLGNWENSL